MILEQEKLLKKVLVENGHDFSTATQRKMLSYLDIMVQWNRVFNLTRILNPKEMIYLHLLDSLTINKYLNGNKIIDIGSGAGLPGIPLAMANTDKSFVLLDSNNKKTRFLTQVICDLKISNVEVIHKRVEDYKPKIKYDSILSRAFASLKQMLNSTSELATNNGKFLAMKGAYPKDEIEEIPENFKLIDVVKLEINNRSEERHLVRMEKTN